jgi:hypothetical protein
MPAGSDDSHYEQAFREKILPAEIRIASGP